jgi:hypothetical protein
MSFVFIPRAHQNPADERELCRCLHWHPHEGDNRRAKNESVGRHVFSLFFLVSFVSFDRVRLDRSFENLCRNVSFIKACLFSAPQRSLIL